MLFGEYPFISEDMHNILDNILKNPLKFPNDNNVSDEVISLI